MFEKNVRVAQEVVFFIEDDEVCKEMMFTEFEAVLDGVVGFSEFSSKNVRCIFAVINPGLNPYAFVFFNLAFDEQGEPPKTWNVPFQTLIQKATKSQIGSYDIKLITHSNCAVDYVRSELWDPTEQHIETILAVIQDNRLCLTNDNQFEDAYGQVGNANSMNANQQGQFPDFLQQLAQTLAGGTGFDRAAVEKIEDEFRSTIKTLTEDLHQATDRVKQLEDKNSMLLEKMYIQKNDFDQFQRKSAAMLDESVRQAIEDTKKQLKSKFERRLKNYEQEYKHRYNEKVRQMKVSSSEKSKSLKEKTAILNEKDLLLDEKKMKIDTLTEDLQATKTRLAEKENEFLRLSTKFKQMSEELAVFRREKLRLMADGADKFFDKLEQSGLNFIAYHPGAGHVSVGVSQIGEYLANPRAFAANKIGLSQDAYEYWLEHYHNPCCQAPIIGGKTCEQKIPRHDNPRDFTPGMQDRCDKHRTGVSAAGRVFSS